MIFTINKYEGTCRYFRPSSPKRGMESDHSSILSEVETEISTLSWPALLLAGGVAGIAGWTVTFPLDVVKTRVQGAELCAIHVGGSGASTSKSLNPYRTTLSTIIYSYQTEGLAVFFRGLAPTLIRCG
jgi:solute carrier family 25 carnitine/acylcarnitine transporter 20/29